MSQIDFHAPKKIWLKQDPPVSSHKSFKLKSAFNLVGLFQLEFLFSSTEHDLHKQKYGQPRDTNLNKQRVKVVKVLRSNTDIIIKPADEVSAIVVLNKTDYITEGLRQLLNA